MAQKHIFKHRRGLADTWKKWLSTPGNKLEDGEIGIVDANPSDMPNHLRLLVGDGKEHSYEDMPKFAYAQEENGSVVSHGYDYAEYFCWANDVAPEDRVAGRFVTIAENTRTIRLAQPGDKVLGITSNTASIIGNWDEERDIVDWAIVGMLGIVEIQYEGDCTKNGYAMIGENGIAVPAVKVVGGENKDIFGYKIVNINEDAGTIEVVLGNDSDIIARMKDNIIDIETNYAKKIEVEEILDNLAEINIQSDWNQTDENRNDYIKNKPTILSEEDVIGLIKENGGGGTIPTKTSQLINDSGFVADSAYNYVKKCATGANQAVAFENYEEFVEYFNKTDNLPNNITPNIGQIIVIKDPNVPNLWVAETYWTASICPYEFINNEEFLADMEKYDEGLLVGCHTFLPLETKKNGSTEVDLTGYVKDENYVHTDNNFTDEEKEKLQSVENGSQKNMIETVKVNGNSLSIKEKAVDINVPTKLSELNNDGNFVQDVNYVHTDNNFTDEYISTINGSLTYSLTAINIAKGANRAVSFNNYSEMIDFLNLNPNWGQIDTVTMEYQIGQNIMIGTINVPDLWIASDASGGYSKYTYTTDEAFVNDLNNALANGEFLRVGFVSLGVLETQKVALAEYPTYTQMNDAIQSAIGDVLGGAS